MKEHSEFKSWFISKFDFFETSLNGQRANPFHEQRQAAIARFAELPFPTTKDEEWKYTNVAPMLRHRFELGKDRSNVGAAQLAPYLFENLAVNLLVFVDGYFAPRLSSVKDRRAGLIVSNLAKILAEQPELVVPHLARYADFQGETFTALNTAFAREGVVILLPKDTVLDYPVHILHLATDNDQEVQRHPRNFILVAAGSKLNLIESHHSLGAAAGFNNTVSEILVGENALLEHVKLQDENLASYHFDRRQVHIARGGNYTTIGVDLGGALVRNTLNFVFDDENAEAHLYGFYFGRKSQLIDTHSLIDHAKPHCQSNELFKGILDDKARGVFNGKVMVRRDAQKTNAFQENKTLLLTDTATINSKPQLEIFADDVKCTHGATIGQLDEEALFYLRSRGVPLDEANAILRHAFAGDIFAKITIEPVRQRAEKMVLDCFRKN